MGKWFASLPKTWADVNWPTALFVGIYHVALLIMLPLYFLYYTPSWQLITISIVLLFATGMSITAGYHRFYAHLAYKVHPVAEWMLLFFGSMSAQGSAMRWAFDHRIHHAFVDTDRDPYSIKRGFWFAHMLWLLHKPNPIDKKVVSDLYRNPLVLFQHEYYRAALLVSNIFCFLAVGWLLNDFVGAFVLSLWLRIFFLHHFTWFINSLAHTWGSRSFSQEHTAVDNYIISLLTFGEGYHNYHHTFANDYRNGVRWFHFDPTKWLIWTLNKCGLAWNLKRMNKYEIREHWVADRKRELLELLRTSLNARKEELHDTLVRVSNDMTHKLGQIRALIDKKGRGERADELKTLKRGLRGDKKLFRRLAKQITRT